MTEYGSFEPSTGAFTPGGGGAATSRGAGFLDASAAQWDPSATNLDPHLDPYSENYVAGDVPSNIVTGDVGDADDIEQPADSIGPVATNIVTRSAASDSDDDSDEGEEGDEGDDDDGPGCDCEEDDARSTNRGGYYGYPPGPLSRSRM